MPGDFDIKNKETIMPLQPAEKEKQKQRTVLEMERRLKHLQIDNSIALSRVDLTEYPYPDALGAFPSRKEIATIGDLQAVANNEKEAKQWMHCLSQMIEHDKKVNEQTVELVKRLEGNKLRYRQRATEAKHMLNIESQALEDHKVDLDLKKVEIEDLQSTVDRLEQELAMEQSRATALGPTAPVSTTKSAEDVAVSWRQRGHGPSKRLAIEDLDEYDPWEHGVRKKLTTDAPIYLNDQQQFDYILSQMKGMLFRVMQKWISSKKDLTMEEIFDKVQHLMGISQRVSDAKNELQSIKMRYNESITEYYYRIFSLWEYAQTPMDERITKFRRTMTPSISTPLLGRRYTHINNLVNDARTIQNEQKEISNNFPRQGKESSAKSAQNANYRGSAGASGGSAGAKSNARNPNAKFFPTSTKPARWSGTWFNPEPRPKKLEENERSAFARQGRCWACRGSGHRSSNECCPEFKKRVNVTKVMEEVTLDLKKNSP